MKKRVIRIDEDGNVVREESIAKKAVKAVAVAAVTAYAAKKAKQALFNWLGR